MPGLWFPDLQSFDWCLEIRPAVHVLTTGHEDDPKVVSDHFAERLGSSRFVYRPREIFAAVAQTEEEIHRFRYEAEALIQERDLALLATVYRRDARKWLVVDEPMLTASDSEIEAELTTFHDLETQRFLDPLVLNAQRDICERFAVPYVPTPPEMKVGIILDGAAYPINGFREPEDPAYDDLSGWWIWRGERDFPRDSVFLEALHAVHLPRRCPEVMPYLALPAGWRFLIAPGHEDVWLDPTLLKPS